MSEGLDQKYQRTVYWVYGPQSYIDLRVDEASKQLDELLEEAGVMEWALITAWNPRSQLAPPPENRRAQEALEREVGVRYTYWTGVGAGTNADWPPEEGLFILGIPEPEAVELARRFGQNAIVAGRKGEPARLVWCLPAEGDLQEEKGTPDAA